MNSVESGFGAVGAAAAGSQPRPPGSSAPHSAFQSRLPGRPGPSAAGGAAAPAPEAGSVGAAGERLHQLPGGLRPRRGWPRVTGRCGAWPHTGSRGDPSRGVLPTGVATCHLLTWGPSLPGACSHGRGQAGVFATCAALRAVLQSQVLAQRTPCPHPRPPWCPGLVREPVLWPGNGLGLPLSKGT